MGERGQGPPSVNWMGIHPHLLTRPLEVIRRPDLQQNAVFSALRRNPADLGVILEGVNTAPKETMEGTQGAFPVSEQKDHQAFHCINMLYIAPSIVQC